MTLFTFLERNKNDLDPRNILLVVQAASKQGQLECLKREMATNITPISSFIYLKDCRLQIKLL